MVLDLIIELRRLYNLSIRKQLIYHIHGRTSPQGIQSEYDLAVVKAGLNRKIIRRLVDIDTETANPSVYISKML